MTATARPCRAAGALLALLCLYGAAGCGRCVVRGTVVDVTGEPLPGVAVTAPGFEAEGLTDALGRYRLACPPGSVELVFVKTRYTAGRLALELPGPGPVTANPVSLWRLPSESGLYLFENYRYRKTAPVGLKTFTASGGKPVFGVNRLPELEWTTQPRPLLVAHGVPTYDVRFCRLVQSEAAPLEAPNSAQPVWLNGEDLPVEMVPIDEPERMLWEVHMLQDLTPGIYALHWGAFQGFTNTDERVFLFEVAEESASQAPAEPLAEPPPAGEPKPGQVLKLDEPESGEADPADAEAPAGTE